MKLLYVCCKTNFIFDNFLFCFVLSSDHIELFLDEAVFTVSRKLYYPVEIEPASMLEICGIGLGEISLC